MFTSVYLFIFIVVVLQLSQFPLVALPAAPLPLQLPPSMPTLSSTSVGHSYLFVDQPFSFVKIFFLNY